MAHGHVDTTICTSSRVESYVELRSALVCLSYDSSPGLRSGLASTRIHLHYIFVFNIRESASVRWIHDRPRGERNAEPRRDFRPLRGGRGRGVM